MKVEEAGSHLDHLLRQTRMHHMELSSMADVKANILLTMSSVVMTLSLRYINDPELKVATLILMVFCLTTIVLATYAVMPHLPFSLKPGNHPDVKSPGFNVLFFGDFARLRYAEFEAAMEEILATPSETYGAQVREIYLLGTFLARKKYRFVRLAYLAFIAGFLTSGSVILVTAIMV